MVSTMTPAARAAIASGKEQLLQALEREHATTMRVLRAFPAERLHFRPHDKCKTARELAWVFVTERGLATMVFDDAFAHGVPNGLMPEPPGEWRALVEAVESAHRDFVGLVRGMPEDRLAGEVKFFTAPRTLGDIARMDFAWFLLHDEIHHRGQFSIYLRMVGGKVPSIYGPTLDEPWM